MPGSQKPGDWIAEKVSGIDAGASMLHYYGNQAGMNGRRYGIPLFSLLRFHSGCVRNGHFSENGMWISNGQKMVVPRSRLDF